MFPLLLLTLLSASFLRVAALGVVVIATFALCFLPFLHPFPSALLSVLHRLFPFARGLYEDKVSNVWCATSVLIKWTSLLSREALVRMCMGATLLALLPSCIHSFRYPSRRSFVYALGCSSWSFFLLGFQVHEKNVLQPLLPLCTLLLGQHPLLAAWMGGIGAFSVYPLLRRDGQALPYAALQLLWAAVSLSVARSSIQHRLRAVQVEQDQEEQTTPVSMLAARIVRFADQHTMKLYRLVQLSFVGCAILHALWFVLPSIARFPDLLPMLFVLYSTPQFILAYLALLVNQYALPLQRTEDEDLRDGWQGQTQRSKRE